MERRETIARVLAGLGIAGTVAGGALLTIDLKRARGEQAARLSAQLDCERAGCGVSLGGKF